MVSPVKKQFRVVCMKKKAREARLGWFRYEQRGDGVTKRVLNEEFEGREVLGDHERDG